MRAVRRNARRGGGRPEQEFQQAVLDLARLAGWMAYHTHDSRRSAAGFPDLILVRGKRIIAAELKTGRNRPTETQREWLEALDGGTVESVLWRPEEMDGVVAALTAREEPGVRTAGRMREGGGGDGGGA